MDERSFNTNSGSDPSELATNLSLQIEAIIPTAARSAVLYKTLQSLSQQSLIPNTIHVIDASTDDLTKNICSRASDAFQLNINYNKAILKGAASQRMQAMPFIKSEFTLFMDDDIILEENCIQQLYKALSDNKETGGVNAMVTNQQYHTPGKATAFMYRLMNGKSLATYAGKCIGPAWNLLPEDRESEINQTDWLNTTCTLYRTSALPAPLFPEIFKGYSLMEDLALSLVVGKKWKLFNIRTARIFHDSQPGDHKNSAFTISRMEMINRHFIMTKLMGRKSISDYFKFFIFEKWNIISSLSSATGRKYFFKTLSGKFSAFYYIIFNRKAI